MLEDIVEEEVKPYFLTDERMVNDIPQALNAKLLEEKNKIDQD